MWSFVGKKQARCDDEDPADHAKGDCWDHVAFDPEHRLVLGVEFGKRSATRIKALLERARAQLGGRVPRLVTSDEFAAYATVVKQVWPTPPRERFGRASASASDPDLEPHPALVYATVCKTRERGRVTSVRRQTVYGTDASVAAAVVASAVSSSVNTSFVERHNATERHRNARKARRTYRFSKSWAVHQAVGRLTLLASNFCRTVSTLRERLPRAGAKGEPEATTRQRYRARTPAMAAGLTDRVWPLAEWLAQPVTGLSS